MKKLSTNMVFWTCQTTAGSLVKIWETYSLKTLNNTRITVTTMRVKIMQRMAYL